MMSTAAALTLYAPAPVPPSRFAFSAARADIRFAFALLIAVVSQTRRTAREGKGMDEKVEMEQ
jgi:hypothetical protein